MIWLTVACLGFAYAPGRLQSKLETLLGQLGSADSGDRAAEKLEELARADRQARKYLASRLPGIIEKRPPGPDGWIRAITLAGKLKIAEAVPALVKWMDFGPAGSFTFATEARLENNPPAKALAEIGDPSVPALKVVLRAGTLAERWAAFHVLQNIGSRSAKAALREYVSREPEPALKESIDCFLRAR